MDRYPVHEDKLDFCYELTPGTSQVGERVRLAIMAKLNKGCAPVSVDIRAPRARHTEVKLKRY